MQRIRQQRLLELSLVRARVRVRAGVSDWESSAWLGLWLGSATGDQRNEVARCCVSALIRLTAATGHPRLPSRSVRLGRQANASRDMRRPRGTSNHGALLANSHRFAACGLQLADCRRAPGENPAKQCTLLACIKHTGNDRVPEIGRERPLTQCARAANPRAASCKPVDTKIPFIHTSPLHITSLLQSMGFASKGVLWSGVAYRTQ